MFKKYLFILSLVLLPQIMKAQSMSDEQVFSYVKEQQEKGVGQATIVTRLLERGVTVEQLRKMRRKYQAEKNQPGAKDLIGENKNVSKNRLRTQMQQDAEESQIKNNYMVRSSARGVRGMDGYTRQERLDLLNNEIEFLDIDSLLYYKNKLKDESQVFGRNIFNNPYLTFQPNMNMATPANYRLGAGDNVIIDVWGASQETFEGAISPDGTVTIEGIGPIKLGGLSVSEATKKVQTVLGRHYSGSQIELSVGEMRTIQVQVMGEVVAPGTYSISSLSSAFNALYAAGGVNDLGTLRNIKVYRSGRQISTIDVYDYLLNGNISGDVHLQDNDIIVVGPYDCLVKISGKVKRPMFYEMTRNESVKTILDYSGGFTGDAYTKNLRLIRRSGSEYSIHTVEEFDMSNFSLVDGDSLYIDSILPRFSNMAEIRGAVKHPGMFQMDGAISSVRDLVRAAEGLREDAFTKRVIMHREREDLTIQVIQINLEGVLNGDLPDIPLQRNDVLYVPGKLELMGDRTLEIKGEVRYPGIYEYADSMNIEDLILQAGGLTESASTAKVDIFRRHYDPTAMEDNNQLTDNFSFSLKDGFIVDGEPGFTLRPYDQIVVRKSPVASEQQNVTISGAINFSGSYSMSNKNYKLSDLIRDAGGLTSLAYAKGARLNRTMTDEERKQQEASMRASQIALYEEALQATDKNYDFNRADTLLQMKLDLGNTYPVAIDLEKAIENPGGEDDLVLRDGDNIIIPQYSSTVKISGDVMYPITMNYKKGESLGYYIKRAGGYGDNARKSRVYAIYMNGAVELVSHTSKKAVQPGCQIVVPSKKQKNKMSTAEVLSIGSSSASIAAVIATIANLLK